MTRWTANMRFTPPQPAPCWSVLANSVAMPFRALSANSATAVLVRGALATVEGSALGGRPPFAATRWR